MRLKPRVAAARANRYARRIRSMAAEEEGRASRHMSLPIPAFNVNDYTTMWMNGQG